MPASNPTASSSPQFVLASGSPRRREFMELLGLSFEVITPAAVGKPIDEAPLPNEHPSTLVQRLSRLKAEAVATTLPDSYDDQAQDQTIVLAADTVVVLQGQILGKPNNPDHARTMLKQLRRQHHDVYSGLTVAAVGWEASRPRIFKRITQLHQSKVWMRPYTDVEIDAYIASGDPLDKAGAYGIQNQSFAPVSRLEGCFASVMGFPLGELALALQAMNILLPSIAPLCSQHTDYTCCARSS